MKIRRNIFIALFVIASISLAACGGAATGSDLKSIGEKKINDNINVALLSADGKLKNGEQTVTLKFTDGSGKPLEMKAASLNFNMPAMGSMAEMNDAATLTTTDTPGEFSGNVKLQMAGEWIAQIGYEGAETGKTTMSVNAY
jgi:nitrogen fixation protein FixH